MLYNYIYLGADFLYEKSCKLKVETKNCNLMKGTKPEPKEYLRSKGKSVKVLRREQKSIKDIECKFVYILLLLFNLFIVLLGLYLNQSTKEENHDYLVCDLCMGTGTTGLVALTTYGTRFIGFENDNAVFEVYYISFYKSYQNTKYFIGCI